MLGGTYKLVTFSKINFIENVFNAFGMILVIIAVYVRLVFNMRSMCSI
jgi:hypothetical protein